ncbi:fimbrial protein [Lelliottia aquatilis]|uniref:fimbrial protein n=1 Tax=Lelliottia aquatilis TaxID=2080838 RepID=UPI001576C8E9|nr:fimbrial protein [Lelliottia aquatilis]
MKLNSLRRVLYALALGLPSLTFPVAANITFTITGVLEAKTCAFNETTRTVDLPEVDTRSLSNSNGIYGKTDFTLTLNCSGGVAEVNIIPSGTSVTGGDTSLFLNTGSAKNVGLRLLDSADNVLTPSGQSKATFDFNDTGGIYTFSAGYSSTGTGRVSGGSFQTVVTFSLEYS